MSEELEVVNDETQISERVKNPFSADAQLANPVKAEGQIATQAAREITEVQSMVVMAKKFPRDRIAAFDKIINDCSRPTLANAAMYAYSRGGTEITGASIRLAECIAKNWGNIDFGIKEIEQSKGESIVMSYAWDLETNTRQSKIFKVPHLRETKKGSYKVESARDIYELVANNGARRLRACILGIIPSDVIDSAIKQCELTLRTDPENSSPEKIKKLVESFAALGVPLAAIEKRIQRRIDSILPAQVVQLRKVYTSIKDEMGTPSDFFELAAPSTGENEKEKGVSKLKGKLTKGDDNGGGE